MRCAVGAVDIWRMPSRMRRQCLSGPLPDFKRVRGSLRFTFDDVWKAKSVAAVVQVVGTPALSAAATSADRTYAAGEQYLFIPTSGSVALFQDNNCSLTQTYSASLSGLRPPNAPGIPKNAGGLEFPILPVVAGLAALPLVVGIVALAPCLRRRASSVLHEV
jgi:hypothetical protein